jgi:hypothetical protein
MICTSACLNATNIFKDHDLIKYVYVYGCHGYNGYGHVVTVLSSVLNCSGKNKEIPGPSNK